MKNVTMQLRWMETDLWERNEKRADLQINTQPMFRPFNTERSYNTEYYIREMRQKLYGIALLTDRYWSIWSWRKI